MKCLFTFIALRYEGCWQAAMYSGYGSETFSKGSTYLGQYSSGLRNGFGVCRFFNGDYYEGSWAQGLRDGQGMQQVRSVGAFLSFGRMIGGLDDALTRVQPEATLGSVLRHAHIPLPPHPLLHHTHPTLTHHCISPFTYPTVHGRLQLRRGVPEGQAPRPGDLLLPQWGSVPGEGVGTR